MMYVAFLLTFLTVIYAATLASFAWEDLVTGLVFASVFLAVFRRFVLPAPLPQDRFVFQGIIFFPKLVLIVISEVLKGTWLVVTISVGLRPLSHPGILKIPLRDHTDTAVAIMSFLVTLSPGSFVVAYDWDERIVLIHYVDISDPDQLRADAERYFWLWDRQVAKDALPAATGGRTFDA